MTLVGLYHRVYRQLKKNHPKCSVAGRWIYPPPDEAMKAVGLEEAETYVLCRHNTVAQYITTCPILELCLAVERRLIARVSTRWWEQAGLELGQGRLETEA